MMIVPHINSKGFFKFHAPFQDILPYEQRIELRVTAIRILTDLEDSGEKPFDTIYKPVNIEEAVFVEHINNAVPIVTFVDQLNNSFYVPATHIASFPEIGGVPYKEFMIAAYLPIFPVDYDFSPIQDKLKETMSEFLGVDFRTQVIGTSKVVVVAEEDHEDLMKERAEKESYLKTYKFKFEEEQRRNEDLARQNQLLIRQITNMNLGTGK